MQKTEVECTFQKPSLVLGKTYADEAAGKAQCQVDAKPGWGHGTGCHLASLCQKYTVSLFCVTPVV